MNSFLHLAQSRQSDRSFLSTPVESDKLNRILESARLAPSACNGQPWKIIVVTDTEKRMLLADATSSKVLSMNHFTKQAPVQLLLIEENTNIISSIGGWASNKHYPHIDMGIIASHICLAAADEGLGSCIIGWCNEKKLSKVFNIPNGKRPILVILLGYSSQPLREKKRKQLSDIVTFDTY
jgi:nitroreductase